MLKWIQMENIVRVKVDIKRSNVSILQPYDVLFPLSFVVHIPLSSNACDIQMTSRFTIIDILQAEVANHNAAAG